MKNVGQAVKHLLLQKNQTTDACVYKEDYNFQDDGYALQLFSDVMDAVDAEKRLQETSRRHNYGSRPPAHW